MDMGRYEYRETDNLISIVNWFKDEGCPLKENKFYVISGEQMNEYCGGLTSNNAYPDDLNILCIELDNITDVTRLYIKKFEVGVRWFDDVVLNNRSHEEDIDEE